MMTSEIAATGFVRDQLSVIHVSQCPFSAAEQCGLHFMGSRRTDDHTAKLLQRPFPCSIHHLRTTSVKDLSYPKTAAVDMGPKVLGSL